MEALPRINGEICPGKRLRCADDAGDVYMAVFACDPPDGNYFEDATRLDVRSRSLPVLHRCHILPFDDARPPNRNLTVTEYVRPFFDSHSCDLVATGYEFSIKGCRFRMVASEPSGEAVVSPDTEVFWEGPPIRRVLLKQVAVLPFDHTLPPPGPDGARPDLFATFVKPYFEQFSSPINPGDEFTSGGVRFRVIKCNPPGGGPSKDTEVHTAGPALFCCAYGYCGKLATQRCSEPTCAIRLCKDHAKVAGEGSQPRVACPDHAPSSCVVM